MAAPTNAHILSHKFLVDIYQESSCPDFLVDRCVAILHDLCAQVEAQRPATAQDVYVLSHAATERFNEINEDFGRHDSELETAARARRSLLTLSSSARPTVTRLIWRR